MLVTCAFRWLAVINNDQKMIEFFQNYFTNKIEEKILSLIFYCIVISELQLVFNAYKSWLIEIIYRVCLKVEHGKKGSSRKFKIKEIHLSVNQGPFN